MKELKIVLTNLGSMMAAEAEEGRLVLKTIQDYLL